MFLCSFVSLFVFVAGGGRWWLVVVVVMVVVVVVLVAVVVVVVLEVKNLEKDEKECLRLGVMKL